MIIVRANTYGIDPKGRYNQMQVMSLLKIGRKTLWHFVRSGRLNFDGRGKRRMFVGATIIKFIESLPLDPIAVAVTKISD